jgi:hypothetical protein
MKQASDSGAARVALNPARSAAGIRAAHTVRT